MESRMFCSGASQGMSVPAASAALPERARIVAVAATTDRIFMVFSFRLEGAELGICGRCEGVVAVGRQAGDFRNRVNTARVAASADEHHHVDRFGNQPTRDSDDSFLYELFDAVEGCRSRIRVN